MQLSPLVYAGERCATENHQERPLGCGQQKMLGWHNAQLCSAYEHNAQEAESAARQWEKKRSSKAMPRCDNTET